MGETRRRVLATGSIEYYNDNGLHRDGDEPAVICPRPDGDLDLFWYQNGKRHRDDDKPACIRGNVMREWFRDGIRHRDNDLPVIEAARGDKYWYKNGLKHRDNDLPAFIHGDKKFWFKKGILHRDNDLPAYVHGDKKIWYKDGKVHRETGVAVLPENNYYLEGVLYTYENWVRELTKMQRTLLALWFHNRKTIHHNHHVSTNIKYNNYAHLPRVAFAEVLKQLSKKM